MCTRRLTHDWLCVEDCNWKESQGGFRIGYDVVHDVMFKKAARTTIEEERGGAYISSSFLSISVAESNGSGEYEDVPAGQSWVERVCTGTLHNISHRTQMESPLH